MKKHCRLQLRLLRMMMRKFDCKGFAWVIVFISTRKSAHFWEFEILFHLLSFNESALLSEDAVITNILV
jgi:hypothetical protein